MVLRVVQWATGSVGKAAIDCIVNHPELELVGCWVHSKDKDGKDVGEIVGCAPLGVAATSSTDDILALDADAVVYAPLLANRDELAALLRSGKNVVTPVGWFYPSERQAAPLAQACADGNVSLHGTGINPGGIAETFPLMLSAMSSGVTFVRAEEYSDIRTYGAADVVRSIMGFGATPEDAKNGPMPKMMTGLFTQSMNMVLDTLGLAGQAEVHSLHGVAVATAPIESPIGTIQPGQVAGQRFHWEAVVDDEIVVRIGVHWLMGQENLDPPWTFGRQGERFEVEVKGNPDTFLIVKGWQPETVEAGLVSNPGAVATAAHCVNSVPYVCAAPPGIVTSLELPLVAGRAHPTLLGVRAEHSGHPANRHRSR
jgi:2,4-diaminopentanoate dehydrogenase